MSRPFSSTLLLPPKSNATYSPNHRFEYLWQDSETYKRPTKMPAPEYVEHLMAWVQSNIDNEAVFPSRNTSLPPSVNSSNAFTECTHTSTAIIIRSSCIWALSRISTLVLSTT